MLAAWLVSLALLAQASAESYTLHHRFLPSGTFVPRGTVEVVDGAATFTASEDALGPGEGWYQVGLESVGGDMITTSTRACFAGEDARLVIHVGQNGRPTSIAYTSATVPNDGSCGTSSRAVGSDLQVAIASPQKVYSLSAPPQVDEGGKVKEPEPEKTFLQKYGLMIAGLMFVLMLNAGAPDAPQEGGGGGGGGGGAAK